MREIKFRAWFKDTLEMKIVATNNLYMGNTSWMHLSPMPLSDYRLVDIMQYTGLKDKNGVEIYDGDIVMITETYDGQSKVYKSKVEFHESCFLVWEPDGTDLPLFCFYTPDIPDGLTLRISVIGNIYENPKLLEVKP